MVGSTNSSGIRPYSPIKTISSDYTITSEDIGKTFRTSGSESSITFTLSQENSTNMPNGTELAFVRWVNATVNIVLDGIAVAHPDIGYHTTSSVLTVSLDKYNMVALKKINSSDVGDGWILTGNVEVVT